MNKLFCLVLILENVSKFCGNVYVVTHQVPNLPMEQIFHSSAVPEE